MNGNRNRRSARIPPDTHRNDREHLGHWCIGITARAHGGAPAENEKASPSLSDKVGEHTKLLARKERRFHAAKDDCAILKQLLARGWEATDQLQTVAHAQPQILPIRAAHETHHLNAAVARDGAAATRELPPRTP